MSPKLKDNIEAAIITVIMIGFFLIMSIIESK
jgi:hypothetical protein